MPTTVHLMPDSFRRLSYRLLAIGFYAVLLAATLWTGYELGQRRVSELMVVQTAAREAERLASVAERDRLSEELARALRERVIAERSSQIDRETARALGDQLKQSEFTQLSLHKELSYLRQLVQEGGRGALRAVDLRLASDGRPNAFRYAFTVTQLAPGFGSATAEVRFGIEGQDSQGAATLSLKDLPNAAPRALPVELEHLQSLSGTFELPDDFEPTGILIAIEPSDDRLIPIAESFPWSPTTAEPVSPVPTEEIHR